MNAKIETGIVQIHGKDYKTVALRVQEFREAYPRYTLKTEVVSLTDDVVVMKATVADEELILATGYAEERRKSSRINQTSALENAETSAIGRALAFLGFGGTNIASADEVLSAIKQQEEIGQISGQPLDTKKVTFSVDYIKKIIDADIEEEEKIQKLQKLDSKLNNDERVALGPGLQDKALDSRRKYNNIYADYLKKETVNEKV